MRRELVKWVAMMAVLLAVAPWALAEPKLERELTEPAVTAQDIFERLKSLVGDWVGTDASRGHKIFFAKYILTAGGTVLMEIANPGTALEMTTAYYLDGDELKASHYCSAGNQPEMRWAGGTGEEIFFDFNGGKNIDYSKSVYMHSGKITFTGPDSFEAEWNTYQGMTYLDSVSHVWTRLPPEK